MRSRYVLASFVLALLFAGPAFARGTLDSILPEIRADHPGRLSDAQPWTDSEGRTHYRIKWMTPEGRILYFNADAETGRYSNSGGDDRGQWNGDGGEHHRGRDDDGSYSQSDGGDGGGRRSHWNGGGGDWNGGGDWHQGRGGDGGWRGGSGDRGGWRGGQGGGDGHGRHHNGNDN